MRILKNSNSKSVHRREEVSFQKNYLKEESEKECLKE